MRFEANGIYHVYNRGNRGIPIFYKERNYDFFLNKIKTHIKPHASVLAYCLMPNHFHLMIRIRELAKDGALNNEIATLLRSYTWAINI